MRVRAGPGGHLSPDTSPPPSGLPRDHLFARAVGAVVVASRREPVSRRLARAIEHSRTSINPFQGPTTQITDERAREIGANIALTLHRTDTTLRKAFKEFGLDPKNPLNWRHLLLDLANLHFKGPPRGSPPEVECGPLGIIRKPCCNRMHVLSEQRRQVSIATAHCGIPQRAVQAVLRTPQLDHDPSISHASTARC